ncbi:hypothetical protein PILCRDRAFT_86828 [Piloderma croceum F 1598]|uniref:Uncharacterized protein n=1 Tax=Piloderma croceum (strain F 1598) TaxID=765440 RepID=A0A0C3G4T3_PILCF|nr:hypothetical protein PILCRDRAFT_86828 [Piloderma croceum F 1598]
MPQSGHRTSVRGITADRGSNFFYLAAANITGAKYEMSSGLFTNSEMKRVSEKRSQNRVTIFALCARMHITSSVAAVARIGRKMNDASTDQTSTGLRSIRMVFNAFRKQDETDETKPHQRWLRRQRLKPRKPRIGMGDARIAKYWRQQSDSGPLGGCSQCEAENAVGSVLQGQSVYDSGLNQPEATEISALMAIRAIDAEFPEKDVLFMTLALI